MTRSHHKARVTPVVCAACLASSLPFNARGQSLPSDAQPMAAVPPAIINGWFQGGHAALDGAVTAPDSVSFPNIPNASFYQWAEQSLLWLTSPDPTNPGHRKMESSTFFDVSPPDAAGNQGYQAHVAGTLRTLNLRAAQVGPNGLRIIIDRDGRALEVERAPKGPNGKPMIRRANGDLVEVGRMTLSPTTKPKFFDAKGATIEPHASPLLMQPLVAAADQNLRVQEVRVGGTTVFLDVNGNVVDAEQGQADGEVLQAQNGSLVYFITMVNDVFAYFQTMVKDGAVTPPPSQFPTTAAQLATIANFAASHGKTFDNANALAIEIKTSWVEAGGLPNLASYVTMTATVPSYDRSNPQDWVPNGQKTTLLALVGIHIVGSVAGHPEMIWSTFEHIGNSPLGPYAYNSTTSQNPVTVSPDTSGDWVFASAASTGPFNSARMQIDGSTPPHIIPTAATTPMGPADTIRWKAWGAAANLSPNPLSSATVSNTEIISFNNSVRAALDPNDVRRNYVLVGATWTIGGAAPTRGVSSNQAGTSELANTTMETYQQGSDNTTAPGSTGVNNCFLCHKTNTTSVSHVFNKLKPLF